MDKKEQLNSEMKEDIFMAQMTLMEKKFLSANGIKKGNVNKTHEKVTEVCLAMNYPVMPSFMDVVMQLDMMKHGSLVDFINGNPSDILAEMIKESKKEKKL